MAINNGIGGVGLAILVIILFNATHSISTATSVESNRYTSFLHDCKGSIHDCLIADDVNVEFFFDSEMAKDTTTTTFDINKSFRSKSQVFDAGKAVAYKMAYTKGGHPIPPGERCYDTYGNPTRNRGCPHLA